MALRAVGKFNPPPHPLVCSRPDLYQQHDPYGYRLWPARRISYEYPKNNPRRLTLTSNRDGFRSAREFDSEDDGRSRIMIVGDSFVFGQGVEQTERFSNRLEELVPEWRVDNLGMPGFGADLMLRAFEQVGLDARPEVVVLSIYTDDFRRVDPLYSGAGFPIPRYELRENGLVSVAYPKRKLVDNLHVWQLARRALQEVTDSAWKLNSAILDRFGELARDQDISLVVIFLPGRNDIERDRKRSAWLGAYAAEHRIPFLDLTGPIHSAGTDEVFIERNSHLNSRGHEIVARHLRGILAQVLAERRDRAVPGLGPAG